MGIGSKIDGWEDVADNHAFIKSTLTDVSQGYCKADVERQRRTGRTKKIICRDDEEDTGISEKTSDKKNDVKPENVIPWYVVAKQRRQENKKNGILTSAQKVSNK